MKFSCGETDKARDARKTRELIAAKDWHRVFTMKPVTVGSDSDGKKICVALCWVERRYPDAHLYSHYSTMSSSRYYYGEPEYREIPNG